MATAVGAGVTTEINGFCVGSAVGTGVAVAVGTGAAVALLEELELLEELPKNVEYGSIQSLEADLLNGAQDWNQYSWGGCSLIYDEDIAKRVCTLSELKKTRNGERRPNSREEWLDTQARALSQAARHIRRAANGSVVIL